jgi:diguanylate cyclase (GGDEF)-like protein
MASANNNMSGKTPPPATSGAGPHTPIPQPNQNLPGDQRPEYVRVPTREWDRVNDEREILRARYAELAAENRALMQTAETDPLTGVGNMRALQKIFGIRQENLRRAEKGTRAARGGALIFLDGDAFGQINKIHGDHIGDSVIRAIAASLQRHTRAGDMVFRKGGDEFVILLSDIAEDQVDKVVHGAGGIQARVNAATEVATDQGDILHIECSMGAAHFDADDDLQAILQCADVAMRANKAARKQDKV